MHAFISVRRTLEAAWQALLCLVLLAFACRAVVPAGYMPGLSEQNGFAMTFCTAQGVVTTLWVGSSDAAGKTSQDDHAVGLDCPFGLLLAQAALPDQDAPLPAGVVTYRPVSFQPPYRALPPLPALGPPLGSRAPPASLV